jgi:hypothetical protein
MVKEDELVEPGPELERIWNQDWSDNQCGKARKQQLPLKKVFT